MSRRGDHPDEPRWQPCSHRPRGCRGAAVGRFSECLEHLSRDDLYRVLADFGEGEPLDARGTRIDAQLLRRIITAAPTTGGRQQLRNIFFSGARFTDEAFFGDVQFVDDALFCRTRFGHNAWFQRVRFGSDAHFDGARFVGQARFDDAELVGDALFSDAWFRRDARFQRARFRGDAWFQQVRFGGDARFDQAESRGAVRLADAIFVGDVRGAREPFATALRRAQQRETSREVESPSDSSLKQTTTEISTSSEERDASKPSSTPDHDHRLPGFVYNLDPRSWFGAAREQRDTEPVPAEPARKAVDFVQSTDAMRQSTRWIAGAFAGIGLVLVAGLQLGKLGELSLTDWRLQLAMVAMAAALVLVGVVIWLGSRVLASRYSNIEEMPAKQPWDHWLKDLPAADLATRFELENLGQFVAHRHELLQELQNLRAGPEQGEQLLNRRLAIAQELDELNQLADNALAIGNHRATRASYDRFRRGSFWASLIIVLAVAVFAWASSAATVNEPTLVQIKLSPKGQKQKAAVLGEHCVRGLIPAVVTAPGSFFVTARSSWRAPEVLAVPSNCRGQPHRFKLESALGTMVPVSGRISARSLLQPRRAQSFKLFNPSKNNTGRAEEIEFGYGMFGDIPLVGNWDGVRAGPCGESNQTVGVRRGRTFYLRNCNDPGGADLVFDYGRPTDRPLVGDWDGDGTDTIGVRRGNSFYLRNRNSAGRPDLAFRYEKPIDNVLVGDWDGDGTDTIGVRHGDTFCLLNHLPSRVRACPAEWRFHYGRPSDTPLAGDWGGDGKDTVGVRRGGIFHLRITNDVPARGAKTATDLRGFPYANSGDRVLVGDWDGNGTDELGVQQGIRPCTAEGCGDREWREVAEGAESHEARIRLREARIREAA